MRLIRYSKYDTIISLAILPPFLVLLNWLLFGKRYFTDPHVFIKSTAILLILGIGCYMLIAFAAIQIRKSMPKYQDALKRGVLLVLISFTVTAGMLSAVYWVYNHFHFLGYSFNMGNYRWTLIASLNINIISTFLNEGADALEQWKITIAESEKLKKSTLQKQLEGLKRAG